MSFSSFLGTVCQGVPCVQVIESSDIVPAPNNRYRRKSSCDNNLVLFGLSTQTGSRVAYSI